MKKPLCLLGTAVLTLAATACGAAVRYGGNASPNLDPGAGLTFAWDQETDSDQGDPRLRDNRFFEERLHEAVEFELSLRGIRYDASSPNFRVHHHLSLEDHEMAREVIDASGYSTTEIYTSEQGIVVVHLEDANTGEYVWLGWAQADIEPALRGAEEMRRWVYNITSHMFRRWPVPARVVER